MFLKQNDLSLILNCINCKEKYNKDLNIPKILNCCHNLCNNCININKYKNNKNK